MRDSIYDIVSKIMSIDRSLVTPVSSPENVEGWDSLKHMKLMLELESFFELEFEADQIMYMISVERIEETIRQMSGNNN